MSGGKSPATWPRQHHSPIGQTPSTGCVGSLLASPAGSVPAGKILPLIMNAPPRGPPARNTGEAVRQSHAISNVRIRLSFASAADGKRRQAGRNSNRAEEGAREKLPAIQVHHSLIVVG